MRTLVALGLLLLTCCAGPAVDTGDSLPTFDPDRFLEALERSDRPTVVNVWGSWCVPCRAEAPRLADAHRQHGERVDFVGVDVEDTPSEALRFIEEHRLEFPHLFDREGRVREVLGGTGAPITYFIAPGGAVVDTHFGEIHEDQLAQGIAGLLAG